MSVPHPADSPIGDGNVPDKALEELLAAFAGNPVVDQVNDLDDPTIDTLLGISSPLGADAAVIPTTETDVTQVDQVAGTDHAAPRQTIKIGGDDLPDAVYLSEEAEERLRGTSGRATEASIRGERSTILIAGDEIEGLSGGIPLAVSSASIDPRLRARRIAVRRAIGRRRLKWFLIIGVVIVVVAGSLTVVGSSLFAITTVTPSGAHRIDSGLLDSAIEDLMGTPALLVDTREVERKLQESPWVQRARVSIKFPHKATIELIERVPLATYVGSDQRFRIIAVDGVVVDVISGQPLEFMLIRGPGANVEAGNSSGQAFTHAAELVQALSPTVRSRTALVNVGTTGELSVIFQGPTPNKAGTTVILGGPTDLLDKLTRLEAFLQRPGSDKCSLINVSTSPISYKCPP